jgi:hypothetical protein
MKKTRLGIVIDEKQNKFITTEAKKNAEGNVSQFIRNLIDKAALEKKEQRSKARANNKGNKNSSNAANTKKKKANKVATVKAKKMVRRKNEAV